MKSDDEIKLAYKELNIIKNTEIENIIEIYSDFILKIHFEETDQNSKESKKKIEKINKAFEILKKHKNFSDKNIEKWLSKENKEILEKTEFKQINSAKPKDYISIESLCEIQNQINSGNVFLPSDKLDKTALNNNKKIFDHDYINFNAEKEKIEQQLEDLSIPKKSHENYIKYFVYPKNRLTSLILKNKENENNFNIFKNLITTTSEHYLKVFFWKKFKKQYHIKSDSLFFIKQLKEQNNANINSNYDKNASDNLFETILAMVIIVFVFVVMSAFFLYYNKTKQNKLKNDARNKNINTRTG